MKKSTLLLTFLFAFSVLSHAQQTHKLEGVIVDSVSQSPVEFAAVGLWINGKPIDGTLTDEKGKFKFEEVKSGTYKLVVSFVGYKPMSIENIKMSDKNQNLGNVKLTGETQILDEVEVTGQASLVENRIDKLVYNADKDITNRGGTAEDVLRKVPMLTVDLDGNVSMRGSQNIRVLIDNKPSSIFASSVADALRQIPSDEIKSVEVITSPSAKYDGEGTAGIINIITKKNTLAGITGNVSLGVGYLGSFGFGNLSLRDKKWGISLQGGGRYSYNVRTDGYNNRTSFVNGTPTFLEQLDNNDSWRNYANYAVTFDYDFNKKNSVTLAYRNRFGNSRSEGTQNTTTKDANEQIVRQFERFVDNNRDNVTNTVDFTYIKKFENPDQEFNILAQWSENNRIENFDSKLNNVAFERSFNDGIDREVTLQLDYVQPLGKKAKWEMGAKGILRTVTSDGTFSEFRDNQYVRRPDRENFLNYDQDVVAAYSSFTVQLPKDFGLQAGVRFERTLINADFKDVPDAEIPNYDNFLPSINLTKKFNKVHQFRLSYTQRIQRPSIRFLNPFIDYSNPQDISFGRPTLNPELVDQFELNYNTYIKSNSINVSVYHRMTDNSITQVQDIIREEGVDITRTTYGNIGLDRNIGSNISLQLQPTKKMRIGGGFNAYYVYLDNRVLSNEGWNFSYNANASYSFKNGWGAQFFGFLRSPTVTLQGLRGAFNFHTFSVKKDFKNKKGSVGFGFENPLAKAIVIRSNFEDNTSPDFSFTQESVRNIYRRSVRVDFQYSFGKMDAKGGRLFKRRKSVDNDDLKGGGDDDGMQGGRS
jgi:outer membrane receptor protein involved in Fe transport